MIECKWAKDVTDPEKIKVFRATCKKLIEQEGDCWRISCEDCPADDRYNKEVCVHNGFCSPEIPEHDPRDPQAVESAKAYLREHPEKGEDNESKNQDS